MHQLFHVLALVAFLAALGGAFVGMASGLLFPEAPVNRRKTMLTSVALGLIALVGLAADWLIHNL